MTPVKFEGFNVVYGEHQDEYIPVPALVKDDGEAITCWTMTWRERLRVLWTGRVYVSQLTFRKPLQPQWLGTVRRDLVP